MVDKLEAARARVAALKEQSNKLDAGTSELAELARQEVEQLRRLDEEGDAALRELAHLRLADAWATLSTEQQRTTILESVRDYATHKRTGRGLLIVGPLDRDAAVAALKPSAKLGESGLALYDNSEATILKGLLKAVVGMDASTIQQICHESPALAAAAYGTAVHLSGAFAMRASGKFES